MTTGSSTITNREKISSYSFKQLTQQEVIQQQKIWDINDKRAKNIHKYIGEIDYNCPASSFCYRRQKSAEIFLAKIDLAEQCLRKAYFGATPPP